MYKGIIYRMVHSPVSSSYLVVNASDVIIELFSMKQARRVAGDDAKVINYAQEA